MSRNENRVTGLPEVPKDSDVPVSQNDEMKWIVPTEFVELPSKGRFYPEGSSLHNKQKLEIKAMTTREEDILNNKSLIKQGVAIDRMLKSVLVDKSVNLDELLTGDKNALIVASRVNGFGEEYVTDVYCPACENKFSHTFNLEQVEHMPGGLDGLDEEERAGVKQSSYNTFSFEVSKNLVEIKLLNGFEEKYYTQQLSMKKQKKIGETPIRDLLKTYIVSVNGKTEKGFISEYVNNLRIKDSKKIQNMYLKLMPNISRTYEVEHCDVSLEVQMPFGPEFFWPKR